MQDSIETAKMIRGDLSQVHIERGYRLGRHTKVAFIVESRIETDDFVPGRAEPGNRLRANVAEVTCQQYPHLGPP